MQATIDLHGMDKAMAEETVELCLQQLRASGQRGEVEIVTGRGNHSQRNRSSLRPVVLQLVRELGLDFHCPAMNPGVVLVNVVP